MWLLVLATQSPTTECQICRSNTVVRSHCLRVLSSTLLKDQSADSVENKTQSSIAIARGPTMPFKTNQVVISGTFERCSNSIAHSAHSAHHNHHQDNAHGHVFFALLSILPPRKRCSSSYYYDYYYYYSSSSSSCVTFLPQGARWPKILKNPKILKILKIPKGRSQEARRASS